MQQNAPFCVLLKGWHVCIMLYQIHLAMNGFELTTLVVIGTDCAGSYESNYHTITTTAVIYTNLQYNT